MTQNKQSALMKSNKLINYLSLFFSSGTVLCCALPSLLVAIGAGAALSSFISIFPQLVILSAYKIPIFLGAFMMLLFSGMLQYEARKLPCPADNNLAELCKRSRRVSLIVYFLSVGIFIIGLLFAFILPLFF